MRVRNKSGRTRIISPVGAQPIEVPDGESVEVDDALGRSLLDQPDRWAPAGPTDINTSVDGVLAQVGDNRDRARTALEAEQAAKNPRKGLIKALTKIIDAQEGDQ